MNNQLKSLILSFSLLGLLVLLYQGEISILNRIGTTFGIASEHVQIRERGYGLVTDILIGLTIYLKTSIDFALLIGILMEKYPGIKNQLIIQSGTTLGNAIGTMVVLIIWFFFKEVFRLLSLMIFFASLVLIELAQTSLEHIIHDNPDTHIDDKKTSGPVFRFAKKMYDILHAINSFVEPITSKIMPDLSFDTSKKLTALGLMISSFSVPFILGMDDFAGYVPLFSIVNVFGFGIGVFLGHTVLTSFLFVSSTQTVRVIKNPIIAVLGSFAFIGIALWGFYDSLHIVWTHYILPLL